MPIRRVPGKQNRNALLLALNPMCIFAVFLPNRGAMPRECNPSWPRRCLLRYRAAATTSPTIKRDILGAAKAAHLTLGLPLPEKQHASGTTLKEIAHGIAR